MLYNDMAPKREKRVTSDADEDDDYRRRRERNNEAVKKSRFKSKQRTQETFIRVTELKAENHKLEVKLKNLTQQLKMLKELFLAQASKSKDPSIDSETLSKMLEDDPEDL